MQNVEYKAELRDVLMARSVCRVIGAMPLGTIEQTDTYYNAPDVRFKKRESPGVPDEYILYHRRNRTAPKISRYETLTEDAMRLRFGQRDLPVWVRVHKTRELFRFKNVRIHLDRVTGLGDFLEFEAEVSPKHNLRRSHDLLRELRTKFLPALGEPISCGYADLITG